MKTIEFVSAIVFALALIHSFSTSWITHLSTKVNPQYATLLHILGEVELVFGIWAFVLLGAMAMIVSPNEALNYAQTRNYTESLFVFTILVVAASKPILDFVQILIQKLATHLPFDTVATKTWLTLAALPLIGSLITEPAAMTLCALILFPLIFKSSLSEWKKYAVLGVLFVNISIGGTLTNFAAPPILMVAGPWSWSHGFVFQYFGISALIAIFINATFLVTIIYRDLKKIPHIDVKKESTTPFYISLIHMVFLAFVIYFAHYPILFFGILALFIGFTQATNKYQSPLIYKEAFLVAFFLTGLVVVGGMQEWWIKPLLGSLTPNTLFFSSMGLTAIVDNAAISYLGTLVPSLSLMAKYMLVAGAVVGGGLTLIANAPNPAGAALLKNGFKDCSIGTLGLLLGALPPTIVSALAFFLVTVPK